MSKINLILIFQLLVIIILGSCNSNKLIKDSSIRSDIEDDFDAAYKLAEQRADKLFQVFDDELSRDETAGLKFFYGSMPLSDLADYTGGFYLENIRASIKAKKDFHWSKSVPENIYLNFVLPIRVNNENLDSFRIKYYDELYKRVRDFKDIESAALEINHWCHEKVTYQGADTRTSSPMATILSCRGRCGEESTLTVAALRTVGIPARQVYVPRWAHSDDNHAWVELWVNGEWKFMGACEPEPILNRGWFTEVASRAMLVHTKSFGRYFGNESIINSNAYYSEINKLSLYTDTRVLVVKVVDKEKEAVKQAEVEFKLYNYAEFYTLARTYTNLNGYTSFESGYGDLLVWCSKMGEYGFEMVSLGETDTIQIEIGDEISEGTMLEFDLGVPAAVRTNPIISSEENKTNRLRLAEEDKLREGYKATWIDSAGIADFAKATAYIEDEIRPILIRSMGNYSDILDFLNAVDRKDREDAIALLNVMADKDLRDTPASIILDHHCNAKNFSAGDYHDELFTHYILNPRIANELIRAWRKYLQDLHDHDKIYYFKEDPRRIADWIEESVSLADNKNYYGVPITPVGSIELGLTDKLSRKILFVASCRSYGIPARLEEGTATPQFYQEGNWVNVSFTDDNANITGNARLSLTASEGSDIAEYYSHFTLGYMVDGKFITLTYEYGKNISDFNWPLKLPEGDYILVSGNRLSDAEILSGIFFFHLDENEHQRINLSLREKKFDNRVIQTISPGNRVFIDDKYVSLFTKNSIGSIIAWINHEKEPTKHFLNELKQKSSQFNAWAGDIFLISDSTLLTESFALESDQELPQMTKIGFDSNTKLLRNIFPEMDSLNISLPIVLYVNQSNEIIFKSEGYQLGISDLLLTYIRTQKN